MKRGFAFVLAVMAVINLFAACGSGESGKQEFSDKNAVTEPVTVCGELDLSPYAVAGENVLQDLRYWTDGESAYCDTPGQINGDQAIKYRSDMDTVRAYVKMLEGQGFTLVDYYEGYKGGAYSWYLVCDKTPDATYLQREDIKCHVCIDWNSNNKRDFMMYVSPDLVVADAGLRQDGTTVSLVPAGLSLGAGLLRMPDGSYQTSDGRLHADLNTAMVIRDGVEYHCNARFIISDGAEQVWIEDYYRNEGIFMETPGNYLMQNDLLQLRDFARRQPIDSAKGGLDGTQYDRPAFAMAHGSSWIGPGINQTDYISVSMRVMYLDRSGDAVYYFYASFRDGEPREVEVLCVVSTEGSGEMDNVTYLEIGDNLTLTYNGPDSESYQTYDWEVISGGENVVIESGGNKCKIKAVDAGGVTIRVTYSYTVEEPDVLTGILRNAPHSATQDYHFVIE